MMIAKLRMRCQALVKALKPVNPWFAVLLCLQLSLPVLWLATPQVEWPDNRFEPIEQGLNAELFDDLDASPDDVNDDDGREHSLQGLQALAPNFIPEYLLSQVTASAAQCVIASSWLDGFLPLFLPRPPPFS